MMGWGEEDRKEGEKNNNRGDKEGKNEKRNICKGK